MVRRAGLALLSLGVLAFPAGCGGPADVDRESYVARNLELLATFPTPPGSHPGSTSSRAVTLQDDPFSSYVGQYHTTRSFLAPRGTEPSDLAEFYSGDVEGWRRAHWGRSFATGERSVCYRGSLAGICVRWLPEIDRSQQTRVPFQVTVDSQGYVHRDIWP